MEIEEQTLEIVIAIIESQNEELLIGSEDTAELAGKAIGKLYDTIYHSLTNTLRS